MDEQKAGENCQSHKCCGCKKFFLGVLAGLALAVLVHCLACGSGGGYCHQSYRMMCPMTQTPAH